MFNINFSLYVLITKINLLKKEKEEDQFKNKQILLGLKAFDGPIFILFYFILFFLVKFYFIFTRTNNKNLHGINAKMCIFVRNKIIFKYR